MFDFLSEKFSNIFSRFKGVKHFTQENIAAAIASIKDALLQADVPYNVVESFAQEVQHDVIGKKVLKTLKPEEQLSKVVHDKLVSFLSLNAKETFRISTPAKVMVMGLQGSGKTTTIAKLAHYIKIQKSILEKKHIKPNILIGSVDFYRPAAVDQLEILAQAGEVDFYRAQQKNPVDAAEEIMHYGNKHGYNIILFDTAGRLHIDESMLNELIAIEHKVQPTVKLLVLDAMTGQESLAVADAFNKAVSVTGAVLTKMDSDTRGGLAFAFKYVLKKPVLFIGTGEKKEDFELFRPERIAGRIIGAGDIKSLLEKAEQKIKKQEQDSLYSSMKSGKLTLEDFAQQLSMVGKLGSLSGIMQYLPGMGSMKLSSDALQKGEQEMKKFKAIINSMTLKERKFPSILNASRKQRVAKGAGVGIQDVNTLLSRFEQSQQLLKTFKQFGPKGFFR